MNRLPETVNHQFNQLFAAIGQAGDDLKLAIAEAGLVGDFNEIMNKMYDCKRLQILEMEVKACLKRLDENRTNKPQAEPIPVRPRNGIGKNKRAKLRVKLGGKVIEQRTVSATFVQTLSELGLERVAKLNKKLSRIPLLAKTPTNGYHTQKYHQGWYVTTHFNTPTAMKMLQDIGRELQIPITVEKLGSERT